MKIEVDGAELFVIACMVTLSVLIVCSTVWHIVLTAMVGA